MPAELTISLSDQEYTMILNLARKEVPGATPAQIKAWAERQCKAGLRQAVFDRMRENTFKTLREQEQRDLENFPEVS